MIHDYFSGWTTEVPLKTFPKGVNSISGYAQGNTINLTWIYIDYPSGTTILGFKIYEVIKFITLPAMPPITITIYELKFTLSNSTFNKSFSPVSYGSHVYLVKTYNSGGDSFDNINLTVYVLKTPTNLTATPLSSNSIRLN